MNTWCAFACLMCGLLFEIWAGEEPDPEKRLRLILIAAATVIMAWWFPGWWKVWTW